MRAQTQTNRILGINAGRERRTAEGSREEISQDRRAQVFRQDADHAGNSGDPIRAEQVARTARLALVVLALHENEPRRGQRSIAEELGIAQQTVSWLLRDFRKGRRDTVTGKLIPRTCGCKGKQKCFTCSDH